MGWMKEAYEKSKELSELLKEKGITPENIYDWNLMFDVLEFKSVTTSQLLWLINNNNFDCYLQFSEEGNIKAFIGWKLDRKRTKNYNEYLENCSFDINENQLEQALNYLKKYIITSNSKDSLIYGIGVVGKKIVIRYTPFD